MLARPAERVLRCSGFLGDPPSAAGRYTSYKGISGEFRPMSRASACPARAARGPSPAPVTWAVRSSWRASACSACAAGACYLGSLLNVTGICMSCMRRGGVSLGRFAHRGGHLHVLHAPRGAQVQRLDEVLAYSHLAQRVDKRLCSKGRMYQRIKPVPECPENLICTALVSNQGVHMHQAHEESNSSCSSLTQHTKH